MATSKNIKVILSLDDAGYTARLREATGATQALRAGLGELGTSNTSLEKSMGALGSSMEMIGKSLKSLEASLKSSLAGFAGLDRAQKKSATTAKESSAKVNEAKLATLKTEQQTNAKLLAERQALLARLKEVQARSNADADAMELQAQRSRRQKQAGSAAAARAQAKEAASMRNLAGAVWSERTDLMGQIGRQKAEMAARAALIAGIEAERAAVIATAKAKLDAANVATKAITDERVARRAALAEASADRRAIAALDKQVARESALAATEAMNAKIAADKASVRSALDATKARIAAAKEAGAEERRQAESMAVMWKSLAQLYAASKIFSGLKASVRDADNYARVVERVEAANIGGEKGKERTFAVSKSVEAANPNMSQTDALKLTMAGVAGTVSTDMAMLGKVLPEIAKMVTVTSRQFPEEAHNIEQMGRNLMGVFEARGITQDTSKMLSALDNIYRALILTQGKITVQDIETMGRRGGAGNAMLKNDESILYEVAAASQLKVMGGGGGGGAGGVSTFATMEKMAEKRVQGGITEKRTALENQVEFGLIDKQQLLEANGGKLSGRNTRSVPYLGADEAFLNMPKFAMELVNRVKVKLAALPESDTRFFAPGVDRKNDMVQATAFGRFADQTFGNTNAAEFYKMFATHDAQMRINKEVEASKTAAPLDDSHAAAMVSWSVATDKAKASLEKLGVLIGDILIPVLKPLLDGFTGVINAFKKFGEDNPIAARIVIATTAWMGLNLAIRGAMGLFGMVAGSWRAVGAAMLTGTAATRASTLAQTELALATKIANQAILTEAANTYRATEAKLLHAQMVLKDAQATVLASTGMARLSAVTSTLIPAQNRLASATQAHAASHAALGAAMVPVLSGTTNVSTAQRIMAGTTRLLGGALALVGGPLGLIAIALLVGISLWGSFGSAAEKAARKAGAASLETANSVAAAIARMRDEQAIIKGGENAVIYEKAEKDIANLKTEKGEAAQRLLNYDKLTPNYGGSANDALAADAAQSSMKKAASERVTWLEKEIATRERNLGIMRGEEKTTNDKRAEAEKKASDAAKARMQVSLAAGARNPAGALGPASLNEDGTIDESLLDATTVNVAGLFKNARGGAERTIKPDRTDPLTRALAVAGGTVESQRIKLEALKRGVEEVDDIRKEVTAEVEGRRMADDYSKDRASVNRPGPNNGQIQQLIATLTVQREQAEQVKALTFVNERLAASTLEVDTAMERLTSGNVEKETDAFRALGRELERAEIRLGVGASGFNAWKEAKDKALATQAMADLLNFGATYADKNKTDATSLIRDDKGRQKEEIAATNAIEDAKYAKRLDTAMRTHAAELEQASAWEETEAELAARLLVIDTTYQARKAAVEQAYGARKKNRDAMDAKAQETALERLQRQWEQTTTAVEDIQANAANSFVSMLTSSLGTGRLEIGKFLIAIVQDILNAKIKQTLAGQLSGFADASGGFLSKILGTGSGGVKSSANYAAMDLLAQANGGIVGPQGQVDLPMMNAFASGGIMTAFGPLELRKYASGGVTNRPQLALYGEAGPEAYVPLPDGHTIPVTMSGGGQMAAPAPTVTVNVINQSGTQVSAQQGQPRFDGKQMILDVVLSAASMPGGFRDGMKGALR